MRTPFRISLLEKPIRRAALLHVSGDDPRNPARPSEARCSHPNWSQALTNVRKYVRQLDRSQRRAPQILPRSEQDRTRARAAVLSAVEHHFSVYDHVLDASSVLVRLLVSGVVDDG